MPKVVDHIQYRKELLAGSFECFAEKGYAAMTMRQLAANLGVSTGTLYHYFPGKQAIFEALVEYMADRDLLMASKLEEKPGTLEERIEALIEFGREHEDYFLKQTAVWVDFFRHHGREAVANNPAVVRACERYGQWISSYLGTDEPAILAFVSSFLNGLVLELALEHYRISIEEQSALLAATIRAYTQSKSS